MLTLKYEGPYLLPWLAWHKLAGIERIFLYLDDPLGTDAHVHAPILDAVGRVPWVSVTTMCAARPPHLTAPAATPTPRRRFRPRNALAQHASGRSSAEEATRRRNGALSGPDRA